MDAAAPRRTPLPEVTARRAGDLRLGDIPVRETVELTRIDLPLEQAEPLLERGLLPGCRICPVRMSPSGDPIVSIDGSILALRRETAACLCVRLLSQLDEPTAAVAEAARMVAGDAS